ncbi:MAG: class I SAM-dependent methyltransferase [Pseudomonadota bacterium]
MNLTELANFHGSDKGLIKEAHHYTKLYEMLLYPYRDKPVSILELGLQIGGPEQRKPVDRKTTKLPSINMWIEYLPFARIFGLDISDFSWFSHERFTFIRCDMDNREEIAQAARNIGQSLDFIIDDASHASNHQQYAFLEFWPWLKPGGLYIIEDLHWQSPVYETPGFTKTNHLFRSYVDAGTFSHSNADVEEEFNALSSDMGFCQVFRSGYASTGADKVMVIQKAPKI